MNPFARLCLRHAISFRDFEKVAQRCFVEAARQQLESRSEKVNSMRLSAVTGLNRKITASYAKAERTPVTATSVYAKVITLWLEDPAYSDEELQEPRALTVVGRKSEFAQLVRRVTEDLSVKGVLNHLLHTGSIVREDERVRLVKGSYDPNQDVFEAFTMLEADIDDLIVCVEENAFQAESMHNLHLTTEADEIPVSVVCELKAWILEEGQRFHRRLRQQLARYDQSLAPRGSGAEQPEETVRVSIGTFSRVEDSGDS